MKGVAEVHTCAEGLIFFVHVALLTIGVLEVLTVRIALKKEQLSQRGNSS